jgi:hypothetical protein
MLMEKELVTLEEEDLKSPEYTTEYTNLTPKKIKRIERIIRKSYEYRVFIIFLKTTLDLNRCAYISGYNLDIGSVEIHHTPFTLYDYTETVANKHLTEKGHFKSMEVAEDVCYLHYLFKVGLIPLNPTAHELADSKEFPIHPDLCLGYWEEFYNEYKSYCADTIILKYKEAKEAQKHNDLNNFPELLKRHELRLHIPNQISIKNYDISGLLKEMSIQKLNELQDRRGEINERFIQK